MALSKDILPVFNGFNYYVAFFVLHTAGIYELMTSKVQTITSQTINTSHG